MSSRGDVRPAAGVLALVVCAASWNGPAAFAQETSNGGAAAAPAETSAPAGVDADRLPVDIGKIQRALSRPSALKLETNRSVFRVEIFGRRPTIEDILGRDFLRGPVPGAGMTHQEFLNMVTPKDVQGYAAFDNKQAFTVAATSLALQWAVQKAVQKFNDAKEERAREAARREVEAALAELRRARRAAGLPDK
ncbi:MAG TPA: hypothetical protein VE379_11845 [Vicinamibacterales bacterium]|jgi:hypothetical protein|nr:hypothetical protein [Vicinamibacterales bacterium]